MFLLRNFRVYVYKMLTLQSIFSASPPNCDIYSIAIVHFTRGIHVISSLTTTETLSSYKEIICLPSPRAIPISEALQGQPKTTSARAQGSHVVSPSLPWWTHSCPTHMLYITAEIHVSCLLRQNTNYSNMFRQCQSVFCKRFPCFFPINEGPEDDVSLYR